MYSDNFVHFQADKKNKHHINRNIDYIHSILKKNNFEIIYTKPMFFFMNTPVDSNSKILKKIWNLQVRLASKNNFMSSLVGICFYPIEYVILIFLKQGPSTEIIVCQKK